MLPEILFPVGTSMQDLTTDDFNLLNGTRYEKDAISVIRSIESPRVIQSAQKAQNNSHPEDILSNKLLLCGSDNHRLMSRGGNNTAEDCHSEIGLTVNKSSVNEKNETSIGKNVKTQSTKTSPVKRKRAIKLRFHHQALPPEYLSHYEAAQNEFNSKLNAKEAIILERHTSAAKNTHDNVRSWLRKIAEVQNNSPQESKKLAHDLIDPATARQSQSNSSMKSKSSNCAMSNPTKRIVNYSDLPYMGEITLENSKPRRGRKPKKADICHLIYKNYGTIFPGTPKNILKNHNTKLTVENNLLNSNSDRFEESEIDNNNNNNNNNNQCNEEKPLNLCLRDQSFDDRFSSSSGNDDESDTITTNSNCSTPIATLSDSAADSILAASLKNSLRSLHENIELPTLEKMETNQQNNSLIHPMNLYYQKLIESGTLLADNPRAETVNRNNQLSLKITIPNGFFMMNGCQKEEASNSIRTEISPTANSNLGSQSANNSSVLKRKRSAIFIPPMPIENTSNPATEVSICKFKFTGGPKPSLEEKKMLSVDSDGNYRYYSGTGDKSMRGYEFFPRESLQQSGVVPGINCAGAFLNATGEKISGDIQSSSIGMSKLDSPMTTTSSSPSSQSNSSSQHFSQIKRNIISDLSTTVGMDRKKKSRRSIQKEKLEKTFKEKGFLIQTQKLESAEGATYCKFRQLKKFTRYLFRNWKDYLPEELQQANAAAAAAVVAASKNPLPRHDSPRCQSTAIENIFNGQGKE